MREHAKLYTAYAAIASGVGAFITDLFHPLTELKIIGGFSIFVGFVILGDYFLSPRTPQQFIKLFLRKRRIDLEKYKKTSSFKRLDDIHFLRDLVYDGFCLASGKSIAFQIYESFVSTETIILENKSSTDQIALNKLIDFYIRNLKTWDSNVITIDRNFKPEDLRALEKPIIPKKSWFKRLF